MFNYLTEQPKQQKTKYTKMNQKSKVKYSRSKGTPKKLFQPGGRGKANHWGISSIESMDCKENKNKNIEVSFITITPQKIPSNNDWYMRMSQISNE